MMRFKSTLQIILSLLFVASLYQCAKRGRPSGGPKDEDAPLFVTANPPYKSTFFTAKKIKISFNEYIRLQDVNKQLVVSPPLKYPPLISPQGTASESIQIQLLDTLLENTTYTFDFGNSVQDNNERNILERFKYVFSTGSYIDSLTTRGNVKDALKRIPDVGLRLLLYPLDSSYTDSIVFKQKPKYVTSTLDTVRFEFTNLKEGTYQLIGLKDQGNDYLFDPERDFIAFYSDTLRLPQDSVLVKPLTFFKEERPFAFKRAYELKRGKLAFGFEGDAKGMKVELITPTDENFRSIAKFDVKTDSLNYWYTPVSLDSLQFIVSKDSFKDTITVPLRKKEIDSLLVQSSISRTLEARDTFYLKSNNPLVAVDTSKFVFVDKDTIKVPYNTVVSDKENAVAVLFNKQFAQSYALKILPKALTDIYGYQNDTLSYTFTTKSLEDYGRINLQVSNPSNDNLIVILTQTNKNDVVASATISSSQLVVFDLIKPGKYDVKIVIDTNKNGKWDTGNFLLRRQPERIIYHSEVLEVRPNWELNEQLTAF